MTTPRNPLSKRLPALAAAALAAPTSAATFTLDRAVLSAGAASTATGLAINLGQPFVGDGSGAAGAASYGILPLVTPPEPPCPGDADGSGAVDSLDLNTVLANLGASVPSGAAGDLDADGLVDSTDLNIVLANYGDVCADQ